MPVAAAEVEVEAAVLSEAAVEAAVEDDVAPPQAVSIDKLMPKASTVLIAFFIKQTSYNCEMK